jgi:hypothetical protein
VIPLPSDGKIVSLKALKVVKASQFQKLLRGVRGEDLQSSWIEREERDLKRPGAKGQGEALWRVRDPQDPEGGRWFLQRPQEGFLRLEGEGFHRIEDPDPVFAPKGREGEDRLDLPDRLDPYPLPFAGRLGDKKVRMVLPHTSRASPADLLIFPSVAEKSPGKEPGDRSFPYTARSLKEEEPPIPPLREKVAELLSGNLMPHHRRERVVPGCSHQKG